MSGDRPYATHWADVLDHRDPRGEAASLGGGRTTCHALLGLPVSSRESPGEHVPGLIGRVAEHVGQVAPES
jgi:hypothetical protein